ncbi:MAG TPA: phytoene desaturase family protein [Elusimicrobiales bacterium]|nr:phytoene desaturase family protein [Elusimicrobiales bacterium]
MAKDKKAVVIGAGIGGLSAAVSLACAGYEVALFEKNKGPGGKLNQLEKDGFRFDLGPSILTMPQIFRDLFARAGKEMKDYVAIEELRPHWRNFFEGGFTFDFTPDSRLMEAELKKIPDGGRGFSAFLEYSRRQSLLTEEGYFKYGYDTLAEMRAGYGNLRALLGFDWMRSMDAGVRSYVKDPRLVDALNYFIKYVGSSPYDAPGTMNLLPHVQFGYGLWYVSGGMYKMALALEKLARDCGVDIKYGHEAASIERAGGRVTAVTAKNGARAEADAVVSNMEVIPACRELLGEDEAFLRSLEKFEPACSGLVIDLGIKGSYPALAHHNFFYSGSPKEHFDAVFRKKELSSDPTIYLVAPCVTDPSAAPAGCSVLKILPHIPHIRDEKPYTKADYTAFRDVVLAKLERMGLDGLRSRIVTEDVLTPDDIKAMYYSNKGSIYGVVSDRKLNGAFRAPKRSSRYSNLFFVGGSVNPGAGMPMVALSGMLACDMLTGAIGGRK